MSYVRACVRIKGVWKLIINLSHRGRMNETEKKSPVLQLSQ